MQINFKFSEGSSFKGVKEVQNMDWYVGCGTATCTYMNGSQYEGEWVNFKRHGKGKFTSADGSVYEGDWVNDKREGDGE